jgi:hypothetical protein
MLVHLLGRTFPGITYKPTPGSPPASLGNAGMSFWDSSTTAASADPLGLERSERNLRLSGY